MDPRMRSATSNIAFAVQDQPIADLSAHAPVPSPHLCEFQLPGRPRRKNKRDQKAEHEELLKAMFQKDTAGCVSNPVLISVAGPMPWKFLLLGRPRGNAEDIRR